MRNAEYIMRNARLDEAQAGIKMAGKNINNLRYADNTTLMAESEEQLKSLLMKVKEKRGKVGLKLNCCGLLQTACWGPESMKREREKERAVSLGLCGKPIKPMHRTCTTHDGTGHPLKEVFKAQARK